jgi:hypothetical protein
MTQTFFIQRSPAWKWLLVPFGATRDSSVVTLENDSIDLRFGYFHEVIHLNDLEQADFVAEKVPWYRYSIGWRSNFQGKVGLIGDSKNVVRLKLKQRRWVSLMGVPVPCDEVSISMEAPQAFLHAVDVQKGAGHV